MNERKSIDIAYLEFSKAFDTASHSIARDKLPSRDVEGCVLAWVKSWQDSWARERCERRYIQSEASHKWCSPALSVRCSHNQNLYQLSG